MGAEAPFQQHDIESVAPAVEGKIYNIAGISVDEDTLILTTLSGGELRISSDGNFVHQRFARRIVES